MNPVLPVLAFLLSGCDSTTIRTLADTGVLPDSDTDQDVDGDTDTIEVIDDTGGDDTDDTDTTEPAGDDEIYAAFVDPMIIQTIDIVLSDRNIRELNLGIT